MLTRFIPRIFQFCAACFVIVAGFTSMVTSMFGGVEKVLLIVEKSERRCGKDRREGVPPPR